MLFLGSEGLSQKFPHPGQQCHLFTVCSSPKRATATCQAHEERMWNRRKAGSVRGAGSSIQGPLTGRLLAVGAPSSDNQPQASAIAGLTPTQHTTLGPRHRQEKGACDSSPGARSALGLSLSIHKMESVGTASLRTIGKFNESGSLYRHSCDGVSEATPQGR